MQHIPLSDLPQEQLEWLSRFADRVRMIEPSCAEEDRGVALNDIARSAWERPGWRSLGPQAAADRWLARRSLD
ncbi:MAG TPA: hypothetical protein VGP22_10140 [Albitalea sp.]|jgi:hypothetical protein|nr:hypothetical protein [Albitalea sp.]